MPRSTAIAASSAVPMPLRASGRSHTSLILSMVSQVVLEAWPPSLAVTWCLLGASAPRKSALGVQRASSVLSLRLGRARVNGDAQSLVAGGADLCRSSP